MGEFGETGGFGTHIADDGLDDLLTYFTGSSGDNLTHLPPPLPGCLHDSEDGVKLVTCIPRVDNLRDNFRFHPTVTPRGINFYEDCILTADQQKELNILKADVTRENNKYLAEHPEVSIEFVSICRPF